MKKQASLKLNFIMNTFLTLSSFLFPLITYPYASRILMPEGIGKVSFATTVVTIFSMFAELGIPTYGIRECARVRDDKRRLSCVVHELFLINIITSIFAYAVLFVMCFTVEEFETRRAVIFVMSSIIFLNMVGMEWMYKGLEQYTYITVRSVIFKFVGLAMVFVLVRNSGDILQYAAVTVIAGYASQILNFFYIRHFISKVSIKELSFKRHLRPIFVFFAMSCATTIYTNLDTIMLGFMTNDTDMGYYHSAVRIKTILVGVVTSLGAVLLPRASYYIENKMYDEFVNIAGKALRFVMFFAFPLMVYFIIYASDGIYLLSGTDYTGAILPMQVIMPTVLLIGITNILGIQMLIPLGQERAVLYSEIAGAVVDLILNAVFIPVFKSTGAAIGTLAAEFVVLLVQFYFIKRKVRIKHILPQMPLYIIGTTVGAVLCISVRYLLPSENTEIFEFLRLLISSLVFAVGYAAVLIIAKDEMLFEIVGSIIKRRK